MARTWLSIKVELISGRDLILWPRPGRVFAAARSHTFRQLAEAIDTAFARWDLGHLHQFELADATAIGMPEYDQLENLRDGQKERLSCLRPGERFLYTFDLGDEWTHFCTVAEQKIDPLVEFGFIPGHPLPCWGWGDIPDQYGRRTEDAAEPGPDPDLRDLPPLRPW
jgi:hypothetical protein